MPSSSRGFTREELAALTPWRLPIMDAGNSPRTARDPQIIDDEIDAPRYPTAEELEAMQQQARDEAREEGRREGFEAGLAEGRAQGYAEGSGEGRKDGYQQGLAEGRAQGHAQGLAEGRAAGHAEGEAQGRGAMREAAARFEALIDLLDEPLTHMDAKVEDELVALAIAIAKQLIRRELRTDPGQIVATVREAVAILPSSARRVTLHLHPEDAALMRSALALDEAGSRWRLQENPLMSRGGCRVTTETSSIDASVETRLAATIARLLGGEREEDQP